MNKLNFAARRQRVALDTSPEIRGIADPQERPLADLSREELLSEALYRTIDGEEVTALSDDQLRAEVRWRRALTLREPAYATLSLLLAEVSGESIDSLVKGDFSPAQILAKAEAFAAAHLERKLQQPPDLHDLERRLMKVEALTVA